MSSNSAANRRIAKNTMMLYVRTMVVLVISLYTSRVVLEVLGVEDYGIYQVVGGVVAMFSLLSNALSGAISRFITFEIGKGDAERLRRVFSTCVIIQYGLAAIVFVVVEAVAVWFLRTQMQIPDGRMTAAVWVLQFSLLTFCVNLVSLPYNACIIAHERMKAFAYMSMLDASLKLGVCFAVLAFPADRLIVYAGLLAASALLVRLLYTLYCRRSFAEARGSLVFDRQIFRQMAGFSGWSFFTNASHVMNMQGVNVLVNIFFGVTVNAARGLAAQVESAVIQFVHNFTTAVNPQITKSYAAGDLSRMYTLVCSGAKFAFFSMLFLALPLAFEAEMVLGLWLKNVPEYTVLFTRLSLVLGVMDTLGTTGFTACTATGRLRRYALVLTPIAILEFPLTWLFFALGAPVESTYYLYVLVKFSVIVARLYVIRHLVGMCPSLFFRTVLWPVAKVTVVAAVLPLALVSVMDGGWVRLLLSGAVCVLSVAASVYLLGMTSGERALVCDKTKAVWAKMVARKTC